MLLSIYQSILIFFSLSLDEFPEEKIQNAKQKKNSIDFHLFWTNFQLWHAINVDVDERVIKFLLSPCLRIVPKFQQVMIQEFESVHFFCAQTILYQQTDPWTQSFPIFHFILGSQSSLDQKRCSKKKTESHKNNW